MMSSVNFSHLLINALDEIASSISKMEKRRKTLIEQADAVRSDLKAWIMEAYNKEQISAFHVEWLFHLFKLEND